jgi:uncharacterized protein YndB with AHSA1/START domain
MRESGERPEALVDRILCRKSIQQLSESYYNARILMIAGGLAEMAQRKKAGVKCAEDEFTINWLFGASRERVFKACTDPEQMKMWYGPRHFTTPVARMDLRPGGSYFSCMQSPDGNRFCSTGVIREVKVPERIAYTDSFSDEDGNIVAPSKLGIDPAWPEKTPVEMTFSEQNGMTKLTVHMAVPRSLAERQMAPQGWAESFVKLAEYLEKGPEIDPALSSE